MCLNIHVCMQLGLELRGDPLAFFSHILTRAFFALLFPCAVTVLWDCVIPRLGQSEIESDGH